VSGSRIRRTPECTWLWLPVMRAQLDRWRRVIGARGREDQDSTKGDRASDSGWADDETERWTPSYCLPRSRRLHGSRHQKPDPNTLPPVSWERVAVGDVAPDFTLPAHDARTITLSDYHGSRDILLVFYRGHW
jgi:hypothetical protein